MDQKPKKYDLEDRTKIFALSVRDYIKLLPKSVSNLEYGKQLIRSSGSVAANYIEANESLGDKDFKMRIRISRKEAKESRLWLELTEPTEQNSPFQQRLIQESFELIKIFSSILKNSL